MIPAELFILGYFSSTMEENKYMTGCAGHPIFSATVRAFAFSAPYFFVISKAAFRIIFLENFVLGGMIFLLSVGVKRRNVYCAVHCKTQAAEYNNIVTQHKLFNLPVENHEPPV